LAILFGILPHQTVLRYMDRTIDHQTTELAAWTQRHEEERVAADKPTETAAQENANENAVAANR
jgi:hypothetical protein